MKLKALFAFGLLALSTSAAAGPYNDKLAMCLVEKTTEADKTNLLRWMFAAMAQHPNVKDLTQVSEAQGEAMNKQVADLLWALMSDRCLAETRQAVKYEGDSAIGTSFEVLGRVAMQGLMSEPDVTAYIGRLDQHVEPGAIEALIKAED